MAANDFYEEIYGNSSWLQSYSSAQKYTLNSKKRIISEISILSDVPFDRKCIAILPADIGIYYSLLFNKYPNAQFVLVDKSAVAIDYIRHHYDCARTSLYVARLEDLSVVKEGFDIVISILASHLLGSVSDFFTQVQNKMIVGARLFIVTLSPEQENNHPMHLADQGKGKKGSFLEIGQLVSHAENAGLRVLSQKEVAYEESLDKVLISKVFSKFSNSYLYRMSDKELDELHRRMASQDEGDQIHLELSWTIISFEKG